MCGCSDLKYAKKNHTHSYETKQGHAADVATLQAQIDALETAHDTDVTTLQAAIDALMATHAADVADLQAQIDALQQALDDCCGCVGWAEEFETGLGNATIYDELGWVLSYSAASQRLRAIRDNGADGPGADVEIPVLPVVKMVNGLTLDCSTRNDNNIEYCNFRVTHVDGVGNYTYDQVVYTDSSPSGADVPVSVDLSAIPVGNTITKLSFLAVTFDGYSTTYARWYLNYARLVCPSSA